MSAVLPTASGTPAKTADTVGSLPKAAAEKVAKDLPAAERLALTRSQIRSAMMDISHPPPRAPLFGGGAGNMAQTLLERARSLPGAAIVLETLQAWWKQHPLRKVGVVAGEATRTFARPMAQRNPQALLLGAAAVGAVLALTRPWRWLIRPALFVGLVPQLVSQAMKRFPIESWVDIAVSSMRRKSAPKRASRRPASTSAPASQASSLP